MKENRRKHLMQSEVEKMMAAAENGRDPERNTCLLWMCFVHGFRWFFAGCQDGLSYYLLK